MNAAYESSAPFKMHTFFLSKVTLEIVIPSSIPLSDMTTDSKED